MSAVFARLRRSSPLLIVFICVFLDMLGYGMIVPLLPFMVRERSESALLVGLLSSLYAVAQLVLAPVLGALSDRVGRRPVLVGCVLGAGGAYALLAVAATLRSLPLIFLAVALGGAAGASIPTAQAYIADSTPPEDRARGLGLIGAAFGLGLMLGPAAGGLLSSFGLGVPALLAAGLALLNGIYGLLLLPESLPVERRARQPLRPGNLLGPIVQAATVRDVRPLLLAIVLLNLAFAGLQSNFPLYSNARFGWDSVENGVFFAFVGLCAVLTQALLIGRLQPALGEPLLVLGGLATMAGCLGLTALAPAGWALYPLVGLLAVGTGLAIPALTSLVSRRAGEGRQGAVMGGMQALLSLTLVLGPAIAGLLFDLAGPPAPYLGGGLLATGALLTAALGLWPDLRQVGIDQRQ
ncbi:MAG: tetracycline resistance MFS efflux pump [Chloroflexi bacterium OHK40]